LGLNAAGSLEFKRFNAKEFEDAAYELATKAGLYDTVAAEAVEG